MRNPKLPPQITRLVILTLLIVGSYCSARYVLTPRSFGEYGHYRGAALAEVASREPVYAGKESCEECHAKVFEKLTKFEHKTISCESCHGVAQAHADHPEVKIGKLTDNLCLRCHNADPSRPKWLKQIELKKHYTGQRCTECHLPHQPNEVP